MIHIAEFPIVYAATGEPSGRAIAYRTENDRYGAVKLLADPESQMHPFGDNRVADITNPHEAIRTAAKMAGWYL